MLSGKVVGIIGAGNMGEVLIRGLIQSGKGPEPLTLVWQVKKKAK